MKRLQLAVVWSPLHVWYPCGWVCDMGVGNYECGVGVWMCGYVSGSVWICEWQCVDM